MFKMQLNKLITKKRVAVLVTGLALIGITSKLGYDYVEAKTLETKHEKLIKDDKSTQTVINKKKDENKELLKHKEVKETELSQKRELIKKEQDELKQLEAEKENLKAQLNSLNEKK